jgi:hypothetical protein
MRTLAICAVLIVLTGSATAGSASYYRANGSYAGSSITRNGHTTYTNSGGAYVGSSSTRGNTTTVYDRNGSRAGSIVGRR